MEPAEDPIPRRPAAGPPGQRRGSRARDAEATRPAWTTVAAATLSAALAAGFLLAGVRSVVVVSMGNMAVADRAALGSLGLGGSDGATMVAAGITSGIFIGISVLVLLLAGGVLARRAWAREGALGVHGLLALFVLPVSLGGLFGGASRAAVGVLVGLVNAVVVALLFAESTTDDLHRAALLRRGRREQQRPAGGP